MTYTIVTEPNPWTGEGQPPTFYAVQVNMWGAGPSTLRDFPTEQAARDFIAADSAAPVWDTDGMCKWCGIAKSDLAVYPAYWFGCNLCEANITRDDDTPTPDREFEPRHDREEAR
jgi:hypothetical protein